MFNVASIIGKIWTSENRISSDGQSREVTLQWLSEGALELFGRLAKVDGKTKLNGFFSYDPFKTDSKVTQDGFDQVQLYYSLSYVQEYLAGLGIDTQAIFSSRHKGKPHPIVAHANAVDDLNAWYSPQEDDLTFGTNNDKWHLASDSDVTVHEAGHMILDHINKMLGVWENIIGEEKRDGWGKSEGGAIHEGFGDILAALLYNDPEMSEDFVPNIGRPESKGDGLRDVDNNLTLDDVGTEVHERGKVYAGFFWSIKKVLTDPNGPFKMEDREAADLVLKIVLGHAANYHTGKPKSSDFVQAVLDSIDGLASVLQLGVNGASLKSFILAEATKRKLLTPYEPDDWGDDIFSSQAAFENKFGALLFSKTPIQRTEFLGGTQDIYQQQYMTAKGQLVNLVGQAVFVNKDVRGNIISISARDIRKIKQGSINEVVSVTPKNALTIAYGDAQKRLFAAKQSIMNLRPWQFKSAREYVKGIADTQMEYRMAEAALKKLGQMQFTTANKPDLVLLPNSNVLHYEIKSGLGVYYINSQTGAAQFRKDVFVN